VSTCLVENFDANGSLVPDDSPVDSGSSIDKPSPVVGRCRTGFGPRGPRRFAVGGYRLTLVARSTDGLGDLAAGLSDTGADIGTMAADASDPGGLRGRLGELSAPALTRRTLLSATATLSRPTAGGRRSTASRANNGQESARPTS